MEEDLMKTIGAMRERAIGNCRKRIEDAALRAKGLIGSGSPGAEQGTYDRAPPGGVTSLLKRRHGL